MKNVFSLFLLCYLSAGMLGCNTTAGLGEDIEATGEKISEVAEDAKDGLNDNDE